MSGSAFCLCGSIQLLPPLSLSCRWNVYCPHLHEVGTPIGTLEFTYKEQNREANEQAMGNDEKKTINIKGLKNLVVIDKIKRIKW